MDKINQDIVSVEEQTRDEVAGIRQHAEAQVAQVESKCENRRRALLQHAAEQLEPLHKELFRTGELAKSLAVVLQIQALRGRAEEVLPDPGNLLEYAQVGKTLHFRVTGNDQGPVWGTDVYTADSYLRAAAVHAGALESGEEGVVRVRLVDMSCIPVRGSLQNAVMSMDWGPYPIGYRVARVEREVNNS